jgi:hypothetical protein
MMTCFGVEGYACLRGGIVMSYGDGTSSSTLKYLVLGACGCLWLCPIMSNFK